MLPTLWQGLFYCAVAMGAVALTIGSTAVADRVLAVVLTVGAAVYMLLWLKRFLGTYYMLAENEVLFSTDGRVQRHRFSELEDVQYDKAHEILQFSFQDGRVEVYGAYTDLSPVVDSLDRFGVRIEYMRVR